MGGGRQDDGRPTGVTTRKGGMGLVPIGIEKVLVRASVDEAFRVRLLDDREATLAELGDALSATERSVLASLPRLNLATMVDRIDLRKHAKRKFMKAVAAAAFVTAAGMAPVACFMPVSTGAAPDEDWRERIEDVQEQGEVQADTLEETDR